MEYLNFDITMLIRLAVAVLLGGLIGWERNSSNAEAGLRTHIVLCLGATLVMIISESIFLQHGSGDITRMSAQVISGVGFLGVGSIIVDGNRIKGITTAAGLWTTACVGLAVGSGHFVIAATVVAFMLFAMWGLPALRRKRRKRRLVCKTLLKPTTTTTSTDNADVNKLLAKLTEMEAQISSLKSDIEKHQRKD